MKIINLIHLGEEVKDFDGLSAEEKEQISARLNEQALNAIGYKKVEEKLTTDKTV